jgi:hypothetical protein
VSAKLAISISKLQQQKSYKTFYVPQASSLPQSGASLRCSTWVGSGRIREHWAGLERLVSDKNYNLLRIFVNYRRKRFYSIGPSGLCYNPLCQCQSSLIFEGTVP